MLDVDFARSRFPSLADGRIYFDNGGGAQIAQPVLDRMLDYLTTSNVQLGGTYETSAIASARVAEAQRAVATLVNAADPTEVVMGASTTTLLRLLATSVGRTLEPGDEIVVTTGDHEANIGPWLELERVGAVIRYWQVSPETGELDVDDLRTLLGPRTRLVALTHASNILGTINPVREVAEVVHSVGAWLCVDGVGFAPHRALDVQALDVDFYAFSFYKAFGLHHAMLYGRREHLLFLPGPRFYFGSEDDVPSKFQPGNVNYELTYSTLGILDYLSEVAEGNGDRTGPVERAVIESAFDRIADHEQLLARRLLDFLETKSSVRVVGSGSADRSVRVPIISFVVDGHRSADIVRKVDAHGIGIRFGNFYSRRLIGALGLDEDDGVVRVSLVHYNTVEEVDRLTTVFGQIF